jgi:hypothetical protein
VDGHQPRLDLVVFFYIQSPKNETSGVGGVHGSPMKQNEIDSVLVPEVNARFTSVAFEKASDELVGPSHIIPVDDKARGNG